MVIESNYIDSEGSEIVGMTESLHFLVSNHHGVMCESECEWVSCTGEM